MNGKMMEVFITKQPVICSFCCISFLTKFVINKIKLSNSRNGQDWILCWDRWALLLGWCTTEIHQVAALCSGAWDEVYSALSCCFATSGAAERRAEGDGTHAHSVAAWDLRTLVLLRRLSCRTSGNLADYSCVQGGAEMRHWHCFSLSQYHIYARDLRETKQEVKVIWQKAPHGGPIPLLGSPQGVESCTIEFLG